MAKNVVHYWNPLLPKHAHCWETVADCNEKLQQLTLSIDEQTGDYTRLTRFMAGADTSSIGAKSHDYPEEVFIVSGRVYDAAFDKWLEPGEYTSRPAGEIHGPFRTDIDTIVLEISHPSQALK